MNILKGLIIKEFREAFRDRRALMAALFAIVMGPIFLAGVLMFQIEQQFDTQDSYIEFIGESHAPELISYLDSHQFKSMDDVPEEQSDKWVKRNISVVIDEQFTQRMYQGKPAKLTINADYSDQDIQPILSRLKAAINNYSYQLAQTRLLMRGIDPRITTPIIVNIENTATPESSSAMIMGLVAIFIVVGLFTASMTAAIDTSAGERERHSLELILCQPVSTLMIVLSKAICVGFYGAVAATLAMIAMSITMPFLPLEKLGISIVIDPVTMLIIALMIIPLAYAAGITQLFFAYRSKSFKEAQSYLSMILVVPSLGAFVINMMPHKPAWLELIPVAGQIIIMGDLYKGEPLNWLAFLVTSLATLGLAVAMTLLLARSLRSEKVVLALN